MNDQQWSEQQPQAVDVAGIHMPFWSMVGFMVKWAIASIPAAIIFLVILAVIQTVIVAVFFVSLFYYSEPFHKFVLNLHQYLFPGAQ